MDNLEPRGAGNPTWRAGQGGNPNGRPKKGEALSDVLRDLGRLRDVKKGDKKIARKRALAERVWQMALGGDIQAIRLIYDRIDGKATEHVITEEKIVTIIPPPKPGDQKLQEGEESNA